METRRNTVPRIAGVRQRAALRSRNPLSLPPSFLSPARRSAEARKHFVADRRAGLIRLRRENFRIRGRVGRRRL